MLNNRHKEDLDPALKPKSQKQIKAEGKLKEAEMEIEAARNGAIAAHEYAQTKTKEAMEVKLQFNELERDYLKLSVRYEQETLQWKVAALVLAFVVLTLILVLAITNL